MHGRTARRDVAATTVAAAEGDDNADGMSAAVGCAATTGCAAAVGCAAAAAAAVSGDTPIGRANAAPIEAAERVARARRHLQHGRRRSAAAEARGDIRTQIYYVEPPGA